MPYANGAIVFSENPNPDVANVYFVSDKELTEEDVQELKRILGLK